MTQSNVFKWATWLMGCVLMMAVLIPGMVRAQDPPPQSAWLLTINSAIGPATSDYVTRSLEKARKASAAMVILQLDTPGGLDSAMREIVSSILNASIPVVCFVAPEGARAASAGTYILLACPVTAMAPATNLGAATPVQIGGGSPSPPDQKPDASAPADSPTALRKKQVNDSVAYIRGLAARHQRNADWAEQAVREGVSLPAAEALSLNVIDLIADDINALLQQLDGRTITFHGEAVTLNTRNLVLHVADPDWRSQLLAVIANPNLAYILLMVGIYGLIFEFSNPGMVGPGVIGAICLLLAFYALQILPISYVGLALILLGIALMVAEAFAPSFGILGIGGLVAFVIGSVILMDTELPGYQIAFPLIGGFAVATFAALVLGMNMAIRARKRAHVTGQESWIGQTVIALEDFQGDGHVRLQGERWIAHCPDPVKNHEALTIVSVDGLTLKVRKQEAAS